jgi:tetratricopeptide (TPR) repeat protein
LQTNRFYKQFAAANGRAAEKYGNDLARMMTESSDSVIQRADIFYSQGRCDDAIILLTDFIKRAPSHQGAAIRAAELLIDSGRHAHALEYLKKVDAGETNQQVSCLWGICHEALGNFDVAERIADRIIAQKGRDASVLALKARIASFYQKTLEVEKLLAEAVECDPGCARAWYGYACLRRQQGDLQAYFNLSKKAFECSPESRDIALAFHESSLIVQRLDEAEAAFREALSGRRMNRRLHFFLIDLLLRQTKYADAMEAVEAAIVELGVDQGILGAALKIRENLGPMNIPLTPKPGGSVTLCTIVKNEKNHLARCLKSAKPIVDEIIVVDTGSTDETKDIARVFGARVYDFKWTDDFSKARNFALSKASGDWILVLDADEVISNKDQGAFRQVLEESKDWPAAYRLQTRNYSYQANTVGFRQNKGEYSEEQGIGWFPSDKVRMFTNDPRIRFEYQVHELVEPSLKRLKITIRDCPLAVHHYGTLSDIRTLEKTKNYRQLGRKKLRTKIKDASALKELAVQSAQIGNHAEALDIWRRFVKLQPRSAEAHLNMGAAYCNLAKYEEAVSFSEIALRLEPSLKEAAFNIAFSMLLMERAGEAKTTLEKLLGEQPDYLAAQFLLCVANVCLQETAPAEVIFRKLRTLPIGDYIGESFLEISRRFFSASRSAYARRTLEAALHFGCASPEMRALFESCNAAD